MGVDRIKHTKPASKRTFLDELEPIPYEITVEEIRAMDPDMREILFGYREMPESNEDCNKDES
jgi:hypothetical protein